jgi:hypothetical protein
MQRPTAKKLFCSFGIAIDNCYPLYSALLGDARKIKYAKA